MITLFGRMSTNEKREAVRRLSELSDEEKFVIIATGKYIGEGFDFPRLDTLFLAMPIAWKGKVAQYTGRLHRIYQGKNDVIVFDYVDVNIPVLERMYYKRIRGYKAIGYKTMARNDDGEQINVIFDADDYWMPMIDDFKSANREIVIVSPAITIKKINAIIPVLSAKLIDGIVITLITSPISGINERYRDKIAECAERLKNAGIKVVEKETLHQKFAVIDQRIIWYGSVNPLGFCKHEDNMIRIEGEELAVSLLTQCYRD